MAVKMTWDERWQMHWSLTHQHRAASREALHRFIQTHDSKDWDLYRTEDKLANKHYGIATGMFTRKYGKLC